MSFLRHSLSTFATQIVIMGLGIASGIITARVLGPHLKGQAALLTMITQLLYMVGNMGLGSAFSFFIAKEQFTGRQIHSCALMSALFFGSISMVVFYCTMPFHAVFWEGLSSNLIFYSALLSVLYIYSTYLTRILVGYDRIHSMNIGTIARSFINVLTLIVLLLIWNHGLDGVVISLWLAAVAQIAVFLFALRADIRLSRFWEGNLIRTSLSYGIKSHMLLLINFLNYRIDMLLVKHFTDDAAVGFYSLAVGMAELMWLVPNATVAPLFASVAKSEAADRSLLTLRTIRWSFVFLVVLALGAIFLGRLFIDLLYGSDFLPSYQPFLGLLPGICLFPVFKLLNIDLAARGFPGFGTIASAVSLVINVIFNILLIPQLGPLGAALASSLSYGCMAFISIIFFLKKTSYRFSDLVTIDAEEWVFIYEKGSASLLTIRNYIKLFWKR